MTYFNTTESGGKALRTYQNKAARQNDRILDLFIAAHRPLTPSLVHQAIFKGEGVPLTSTRRAITTLTNEGKLEKTTRQHKGPYGRPEYYWQLVAKQMRLV